MFNPSVSKPNDFDWENTRVNYNLDQFKQMSKDDTERLSEELYDELSKIIRSNSTKPFVFERRKTNNVQKLIELLYQVRELNNNLSLNSKK